MSIKEPSWREPVGPKDLSGSELAALDDVTRVLGRYLSGDAVSIDAKPVGLPATVDSKYGDTSNLGLVLSDTPQAHAERDAQRIHNQAIAVEVGSRSLRSLKEGLAASTLPPDEAASPDAQLSEE